MQGHNTCKALCSKIPCRVNSRPLQVFDGVRKGLSLSRWGDIPTSPTAYAWRWLPVPSSTLQETQIACVTRYSFRIKRMSYVVPISPTNTKRGTQGFGLSGKNCNFFPSKSLLMEKHQSFSLSKITNFDKKISLPYQKSLILIRYYKNRLFYNISKSRVIVFAISINSQF